ncbi:MAG: galactokinase [Bryobacteraceae bacterium]|nr:galactokinase [Bryobacteraceae bacterium]MDW8380362.1 galactokinase [Bryobacterales bacterium]
MSAVRKFRAPGRVNLIGEHTDYNGGFVFPAALDRATTVCAAQRPDRKVLVRSLQYPGTVEFDLDHIVRQGDWADYVRGVALQLELAGYRLQGANLEIDGDVPLGAGLSSSAALEVSTALALSSLAGHRIPRQELALLCQRAESEFVGLRCGIMDQYIACFAQEGKALVIDCRSLESRAVALPPQLCLMICNTMVRHELTGSEYNRRREDCEAAASYFGVPALRDIDLKNFERYSGGLEDRIRRRCRHVVTENARVLAAEKSLAAGDAQEFGRLMVESHASLRDDFEVSCPELDLMVELALECQGVYGARMTGGGFGGCTVNLVEAHQAAAIRERIAQQYRQRTAIQPEIYLCLPSAGCHEVLA